MTVTDWFARPIVHVADVDASLRFYCERLRFTSPWRHAEDGRARVAQVEREGCALILADTWPEKIGRTSVFVSLNLAPPTAANKTAALDELRAEFAAHGVVSADGWWGYRLIVVTDPDGNQLLFNYPNDDA